MRLLYALFLLHILIDEDEGMKRDMCFRILPASYGYCRRDYIASGRWTHAEAFCKPCSLLESMWSFSSRALNGFWTHACVNCFKNWQKCFFSAREEIVLGCLQKHISGRRQVHQSWQHPEINTSGTLERAKHAQTLARGVSLHVVWSVWLFMQKHMIGNEGCHKS